MSLTCLVPWLHVTYSRRLPKYPEEDMLKHRYNTGIAVTGGGGRAYSATIGYLAALQKLGLLEDVSRRSPDQYFS